MNEHTTEEHGPKRRKPIDITNESLTRGYTPPPPPKPEAGKKKTQADGYTPPPPPKSKDKGTGKGGKAK
jgi:hypothetical protein